MELIESRVYDIPLDELPNVEELMFSALHMTREAVMEDFDDVYDDTRERCFESLKCSSMFSVARISHIDDEAIELADGSKLESAFLARMLASADRMALYATTVHGLDTLQKNPGNGPFDSMFYNAWGIGFAMACHSWIKERIAEYAEQSSRYMGRSWTPGEEELEYSLQNNLFELLDPTRIGIKLTETGLMSPLMSISGFIGLSDNPDIELAGTDTPSCH